MKKLTKKQIEQINNNFINKETEKAYLLNVEVNGSEATIWVPKSCTEVTECGLLKIMEWFRLKKQKDLKSIIVPIIKY